MEIGRLLRRVRAGKTHSVWQTQAFAGPETITVSSRDFVDGHAMARRHAARRIGDNVSPQLSWTASPTGTAQILILLEDADVPFPRPLIHMAAILPAAARDIGRGDLRSTNPSIRFLKATLGTTGYAGPTPPPGHGMHHYEFTVYALSRVLPVGVRSIRTARKSLAGTVLGRGRLTGTYER